MSIPLYIIKLDTLNLIKHEDALNKLYFQEALVPTQEQINLYVKNNNNKITKYFETNSIEDLKLDLSKIDILVPLYDEYSRNMYLIHRDNVYNRVVYRSYRFPDKNMIKMFQDKLKLLKPKVQIIKKDTNNAKEYFILREFKKLNLMIKFLKSFDIDTLQNTYINTFYYYSNEVGKNITICKRPSFMPHFTHISPYYTRAELINMALNLKKIKPSNKIYTKSEISQLCKTVSENDINSDTLLKHQQYIINNNKIGIIQYYSLQGSFFINQYMRNLVDYKYRNKLLETNILSMWRLIINSPKFDKDYILYRFIKNDAHLKHLDIGDKYTEPSFISTTRDPFYMSDVYKFGFILIKIKIPGNTQGVGLCIETFSHFPDEEEIILPPLSVLQLNKKDKNAVYYHTDKITETKITTRYEFTYLGNKTIYLDKRVEYDDNNNIIDFLTIKSSPSITITEKIKYFIQEYCSPMYQVKTNIGDKTYDLILEWYNSTKVYERFYAATNNNGFVIYTLIQDYVLFTIELGEDVDGSYMYVNYYFRYSSSIRDNIIKDDDFVDFLAKIAFYFEIRYVIIYADYGSCDIKNKLDNVNTIYGGNYCVDFYNYIKFNKKRYIFNKTTQNIITPKFKYEDLDTLKNIDTLKILNKEDKDEIYYIYVKTYIEFVDKDKHNVADFYVYLIDHNCAYVQTYTEKIARLTDLFSLNSPFENEDYYTLDASSYLYNNNLIDKIYTFNQSKIDPTKIKVSQPKNRYRLTNKTRIVN